MVIKSVTDAAFKKYGKVVKGIDCTDLLKVLSTKPMPTDSVVYVASDKDLEVVEPTDLDALLRRVPQCHTIVTTGQKSTDLFTKHFNIEQPRVGASEPFVFDGRPMRLFRMPSSSRAYPMRVEQKAEYYQALFKSLINSKSQINSKS